MNAFRNASFLLAAACVVLAAPLQAQLITYETQSVYTGSVTTFGTGSLLTGSATLGQTFSNVSAVKSMTFSFFNGSASNATKVTELNVTFGQWRSGAFVPGTTVSWGTIVIPASNSGLWTSFSNEIDSFNAYTASFSLTSPSLAVSSPLVRINPDFGYITSPTTTYAMMLTNVTPNTAVGAAPGSIAYTRLGLGLTNGNGFDYGAAAGSATNDWVFSQIVVAPGNQVIPVPESATIALLSGIALVAGLVFLRRRQARRPALAPVSPA